MYSVIKIAYNTFNNSLYSHDINQMESNKEMLSRLKLIGRLQKGEKIDTKRIFVQPNNMFTSVSRTLFNQDNRSNCLTFVQNTINRSFEILTTYERSDSESDRAMCINIVKDLDQSKIGLRHLSSTYATDIKFHCDIDTLIQFIDAKLSSIISKLPESDKADNDRETIFSPKDTYDPRSTM
jgi:hypothetical protein